MVTPSSSPELLNSCFGSSIPVTRNPKEWERRVHLDTGVTVSAPLTALAASDVLCPLLKLERVQGLPGWCSRTPATLCVCLLLARLHPPSSQQTDHQGSSFPMQPSSNSPLPASTGQTGSLHRFLMGFDLKTSKEARGIQHCKAGQEGRHPKLTHPRSGFDLASLSRFQGKVWAPQQHSRSPLGLISLCVG